MVISMHGSIWHCDECNLFTAHDPYSITLCGRTSIGVCIYFIEWFITKKICECSFRQVWKNIYVYCERHSILIYTIYFLLAFWSRKRTRRLFWRRYLWSNQRWWCWTKSKRIYREPIWIWRYTRWRNLYASKWSCLSIFKWW